MLMPSVCQMYKPTHSPDLLSAIRSRMLISAFALCNFNHSGNEHPQHSRICPQALTQHSMQEDFVSCIIGHHCPSLVNWYFCCMG